MSQRARVSVGRQRRRRTRDRPPGTEWNGGSRTLRARARCAVAHLGLPANILPVGDDARGHRGAVVATPAHEHDAELGHLGARLELVRVLFRRDLQLAVGALAHGGRVVLVRRLNRVDRIAHVGARDLQAILAEHGCASGRPGDGIEGGRRQAARAACARGCVGVIVNEPPEFVLIP